MSILLLLSLCSSVPERRRCRSETPRHKASVSVQSNNSCNRPHYLQPSRPSSPASAPQASAASATPSSNFALKYAAVLNAGLSSAVSAQKMQGVFDFSEEILQRGQASQLASQRYLWRAASVIQRSALGRFHHVRGRHTRAAIGEISGCGRTPTVSAETLDLAADTALPTVTFGKLVIEPQKSRD